MGMSIHIIGLKAPTEDYKKKLVAYRACDAAGVNPPDELYDYFGGQAPNYVSDDGIEVDIDGAIAGDVMYDEGATIDLAKLPAGVTRIKVTPSY